MTDNQRPTNKEKCKNCHYGSDTHYCGICYSKKPTNAEQQKLKACPFCGAQVKILHDKSCCEDTPYNRFDAIINCCVKMYESDYEIWEVYTAAQPGKKSRTDEEIFEKLDEKLIQSWNRRVE